MDGLYNGGQTGDVHDDNDETTNLTPDEDVAAPAAEASDNVKIEMEAKTPETVQVQPQIVVVSQPPPTEVQPQYQPIQSTSATSHPKRRPSGVAPTKTVQDNENLWENMSPWTGNEGFYGFYCKTDFEELEVVARERKDQIRAREFRGQHFRAISVYHKKESDRLIIKTKDSGAGLFKTRRNGPLLYGGLAIGVMGLLFLILAGLSEESWGWGVGAVFLIAAIIMILCSGARKLRVNTAEYLTNLVPLHDIKFVEREASTINFGKKKCCHKDNAEDPELRTSRMAIGFSRSNLSAQLVPGAPVEDDYIELVLQANDAYNLHQYLNWYIDS